MPSPPNGALGIMTLVGWGDGGVSGPRGRGGLLRRGTPSVPSAQLCEARAKASARRVTGTKGLNALIKSPWGRRRGVPGPQRASHAAARQLQIHNSLKCNPTPALQTHSPLQRARLCGLCAAAHWRLAAWFASLAGVELPLPSSAPAPAICRPRSAHRVVATRRFYLNACRGLPAAARATHWCCIGIFQCEA